MLVTGNKQRVANAGHPEDRFVDHTEPIARNKLAIRALFIPLKTSGKSLGPNRYRLEPDSCVLILDLT